MTPDNDEYVDLLRQLRGEDIARAAHVDPELGEDYDRVADRILTGFVGAVVGIVCIGIIYWATR